MISRGFLLGMTAFAVAELALTYPVLSADSGSLIPAATLDDPLAAGPAKKIVLAGGCFWGVQGVFQHVTGVTSAISGYAGGRTSSPTYEQVSSGTTGHAESVEVTYDPKLVSLGQILRVFFSVAHDPTEVDRQGPDTGTQYRSAVFTTDSAQTGIAQAYIAQLDQTRSFPQKIATTITPLDTFYPAESYHQDYLTRNPWQPYIVVNDMPKLIALKRLFPTLNRDRPVLVGASS